MKKKFIKCFDTTYNQKIFAIFVDEFHHYTFLEKYKKGNYLYPTLEDYKGLNKIYNEHNPFIMQNVKEYTFKEKVKVGALTLAISVSLASCCNNNEKTLETESKIENESEEVTVIQEVSGYYEITTLDELNELLEIPPVTIEDIDKSIENNPKLDENFKQLAHNLAEAIYSNEPTADLRIYDYNLQTLDTEVMNDKEYYELFRDYSQACYDSNQNKIYYKIGSSVECLYHELAHSTFTFCGYIDGKIYYRGGTSTSALNETFTNKIVEFIVPTSTYSNIGYVLDYLFAFVPYDYNRYNNEGAMYILNDLKEMYPNINISYINDCLNAIKDSSVKLKKNINVLESENLVTSLISLSNEKLSESDLETKLYPYKEVTSLLKDSKKVYPYIRHDNKIIEDGIKKEIEIFADVVIYEINPVSLELFIRKELVKNPQVEMNNDFWKRYALENNVIKPEHLYETQLYLDGTFLEEDKLSHFQIQIGETENSELGFIIKNKLKEKIIYQSHDNLKNVSNAIFLNQYYSLDKSNFEKLELRDILNEEYLKYILIQSDLFKNVFVTEVGLEFEPLLGVYIMNENGEENYYNLNRFYFENEDIYFKDVLKYYGLFDKDENEYHFTISEMNELIASYIEELQKYTYKIKK